MRNLAPFTLGKIIKKLNHIHVKIGCEHNLPFPKSKIFRLSEYIYQRRSIKFHPDGRIVGGLSVADKYSLIGLAYDPVSLFLLDLFRYLEKFPDMKTFLTVRIKPGENTLGSMLESMTRTSPVRQPSQT